MSNLPKKETSDSAGKVRRYFNTYYGKELAFSSNDVDAVIGFLESKGFDKNAAISTGTVLLQQAKIDGIKVFELLDTLKGCLLYTSPSPRDYAASRMPSSA